MLAPLISVAQMREWEQASWTAGRTQPEVIGRVGELVARRARQMVRPGGRVLVLAGKGHNGDDARAALPHLAKGTQVSLRNVTPAEKDIAEVMASLETRPALIVDGLFGIGLNLSVGGENLWAGLIERINELQTQVLSVDVPSGLNADTGAPEGAAIRATVTLTLGAPKRGLFVAGGVAVCGPIGGGGGYWPDAQPARERNELGPCRRISTIIRARGRRRRTREISAGWHSSRAAQGITARRCWRRAGRATGATGLDHVAHLGSGL